MQKTIADSKKSAYLGFQTLKYSPIYGETVPLLVSAE
jgi:hypothetical protein